MASPSSLYGISRVKKSTKEISSSTSLAFTSQLASLLSQDAGAGRRSSGRPRPTSSKADIFTAHNKHAKKRAAKDLLEDDGHPGRCGVGGHGSAGAVDDALLHRSKRKMEEKARWYAAMKRGDYVAPTDRAQGLEENALIDFDRKWAENEERGQGNELDTSSDDDQAGSGDEDEDELIEYTDEFGRQRQGTRAQAAREERRRTAVAVDEPDRFTARPSQPANLIFGDTVQTAAFDPDEPVAAKMDELARRRDRSLTPPDDTHYDAKAEVRTKGVGFYAFAHDRAARSAEMDELERERIETADARRQTEARKEKRRTELAQRRTRIRERRGENQADHFLQDLAEDLVHRSSTKPSRRRSLPFPAFLPA